MVKILKKLDRLSVKLTATYVAVICITLILKAAVKNGFVLALLLVLLAAAMTLCAAYFMTNRIVKFTNKMEAMDGGKLTEKLDIKWNDEISKLGEAFNNLSDKISVLENSVPSLCPMPPTSLKLRSAPLS